MSRSWPSKLLRALFGVLSAPFAVALMALLVLGGLFSSDD